MRRGLLRSRATSGGPSRRSLLSGGIASLAALSLPPADRAAAAETPNGEAEFDPQVRAVPLAAFERGNPSRRAFGRLRWIGGLILSSPRSEFGGISDLVIEADGSRLLAITDEGHWLSAGLAYQDYAPRGLTAARMGALAARSGRALRGKRERDAESMALVSGDLRRGELLIGFEHIHRIGRFSIAEGAISGPTSYLTLPAGARALGGNSGLEAIAVPRSGPLAGAIIAFAERRRGGGNRPGWILTGGGAREIAVEDSGDMDVTGACALPDGGLVLLERRFRWTEGLRVRLRRIFPGALTSGRPITGETLLVADLASEIDNLEGIAAHRGPRGETVLTMISDDNFNRLLQRTLLLQFALPN